MIFTYEPNSSFESPLGTFATNDRYRTKFGHMNASIPSPTRVRITYDGGCPACNLYFMSHRLAERGVNIEFANARERPDLILEYSHLGVDLNRDFVLDIDGTMYVGSKAISVLAGLGENNTFWGKLNSVLFSHKPVATIVYYALRMGRYVLLFLLGRRQLSKPMDVDSLRQTKS